MKVAFALTLALMSLVSDLLQPTQRLYASSALDKNTGDIIVKLVNTASDSTDIELVLDGATNSGTDAKATVLTSASPKDENSLSEPEKVSPESATIRFSGNVIKHPLPGNSFTVLRIPAGNTTHVPRTHEN